MTMTTDHNDIRERSRKLQNELLDQVAEQQATETAVGPHPDELQPDTRRPDPAWTQEAIDARAAEHYGTKEVN